MIIIYSCVWVWVEKRERERERETLCVCVREKERERERMCVGKFLQQVLNLSSDSVGLQRRNQIKVSILGFPEALNYSTSPLPSPYCHSISIITIHFLVFFQWISCLETWLLAVLAKQAKKKSENGTSDWQNWWKMKRLERLQNESVVVNEMVKMF